MKRSLVVLVVCDLVLYVLAVLAIVSSPALRLAGVTGLGVAVVVTITLALAARRSRSSRRGPGSQPQRPSVAEFDQATSLRTQPTWRDDVEGRTGPKW